MEIPEGMWGNLTLNGITTQEDFTHITDKNSYKHATLLTDYLRSNKSR